MDSLSALVNHALRATLHAARAFLRGIARLPLVAGFGRLPLVAKAAFALCALVIVGLSIVTGVLSERYPIAQTLKPPPYRAAIYLDAHGEPFARRGIYVGEPVKIEDVPPHFIDALLAMEDRRFYMHSGVDLTGVTRAALRNWNAGEVLEGGSTITQQLAKVSYLSREKTYQRKFTEAMLAVWIESNLTKREILERYMSSVYFGEGCYGVRAAAKHYYDKDPRDLTVAESALLVAFLRAPSRLASNRTRAWERAELVLRAMVEEGKLEQARLAEIEPAKARDDDQQILGANFADWLYETAPVSVKNEFGGEKVQTTLEPELQRLAEAAVQKVMDKQGARSGAGQAALVAMRPDGRVVAMVGGRDYASSQFNRATQALRQPGSSFKLFVYLAALRAGATLDTIIPDEPLQIGNWEPKNFGGGFRGPMPLLDAWAASVNTVAVRLSETVGREEVIAAARDLGITTPLAANPSLALGASEVTLLELTAAYAAVAAGAYPIKAWGITESANANGFDGNAAYRLEHWRLRQAPILRELMSATVRGGTGRAARLSVPSFGKTGTSQESRNAWFIGYAGNLVVGVWIGNDDNTPTKGVTGGGLPAQIWREFMVGAGKADPGFGRETTQVAFLGLKDTTRQFAQVNFDDRFDEGERDSRYAWRGDRRQLPFNPRVRDLLRSFGFNFF